MSRVINDMLYIDFKSLLRWAEEEIEDCNKAHGWYDSVRSFGDDIALLHSEVSEMLEAYRDYFASDVTMDQCALRGEHSEDPKHQCKPRGVGSEMADVLVRLLDTASRYNIDLGEEFHRKMKYNWSRPNRHGGKNL